MAVAALAAMACGGDPGGRTSPDSAGGEDSLLASPLVRPRRLTERAPDRFRVRFETSVGELDVEVVRAWAPRGVDRFYNLVRNGFYDDARFYRVVDGFVAQFGLHRDPRITYLWRNATIADDPPGRSNTRGRLTFAKGGANSRTTELFFNLRDNPDLDERGFTPIGEVVAGSEVLDRIHAGYGEGPPRGEGPYGAQVQAQGNVYLDEAFPDLTRILRLRVVEDEGVTPPTSAPPG